MDWLPEDDIVHLIVDAVGVMDLSGFAALAAFQRDFKGFARTYKDGDDLADKVRDQLGGWSKQLDAEGRIPLVARLAPWTFDDDLMCFLEEQDKPLNLLFFNIELASFRSTEAFAERWAFVKEFPCCQRASESPQFGARKNPQFGGRGDQPLV